MVKLLDISKLENKSNAKLM